MNATLISVRRAAPRGTGALLAVLLGLGGAVARGRAQPSNVDVPGVQVLTRGPVHEAFAGMVSFNPEPGVLVTKGPPEVIEEVPPAERPEGDNVAWIPGYWAWDDERGDFLWVSGTWRALPPGREWMAGYWGQTSQGYQWISGYWADAAVREAIYLPPPPATVEAGPNVAAPSVEYGWTPGIWIWHQGRYAWRPGYWTQAQADWDWIPAHYVWTPRGYLFVEGYWDYSVERRGILFAPVYFERGVYSQRGYSYAPRIVISVAVFNDHLFLRPRYQHYYFGDYYAASYVQGGYYASYSFQSSRSGYDPFYSRQRWVHRQDREWEHRVEVSFQYRRDHVAARPPRTWAAQARINPATAASPQHPVLVATSIDQLARSKDSPMRFQPVAREERQQIVQRRQEVQTSREQRRTLEAGSTDTVVRKPGVAVEPVPVPIPRSPIVAKPAGQLARNQAPPTAPASPRPDLKSDPKSATPARQVNADRGNRPPESRKLAPEKMPVAGPGETAARASQAQREADQRAREMAANAQEAAERNARTSAQQAPPELERRARDPVANTAEDAKRDAPGKQKKAQKQPEPAAKSAAAKAEEEAQRKAKELAENAQKESPPPPREEPAAGENSPAKPGKKGQEKEGKGKP